MQSVVKKFSNDERGAVAMTFGLMTIVLLFLCGMAMDYSRAMNVRSRVADAADSAALVAGRALMEGKLTVAEIQQLSQTYFVQNVKSLGTNAKIDTPSITVDAQSGAVKVAVNSQVPMTLTKIAGFQTLNFPVETAAVFKVRDIEVGMALDITGSMNSSVEGTRKIDSLKSAFEKFADRLLPDGKRSEQKVRIAVAPYSSGLNLGPFAKDASVNRSPDGCVTERADGSATDDTGKFFVALDGVKDTDPTEGNVGNNSYGCPSAKIVPLSDDRDALVKAVKKFNANGWTAGHIGTQWAWNLISDRWNWGNGSEPEGYDRVDDGKLMKAVVLMTDGTFNTAYHGNKSSEQAIALCKAMKAKGVTVFSVAFDATPAAQQTLKACASEGTGADKDEFYVNAANGDELEAAFLKFASKISELRLSQ